MKVFYIPFNNRGASISILAEEEFTIDILNHAQEYHLEGDEKGIIFYYLTDPIQGFTRPFVNSWPEWLDQVHLLITPNFSVKEGEDRALDLANHEPGDIVVIQPYPDGAFDQQDVNNILNNGRKRWSWYYCLPIDKIESGEVPIKLVSST